MLDEIDAYSVDYLSSEEEAEIIEDIAGWSLKSINFETD